MSGFEMEAAIDLINREKPCTILMMTFDRMVGCGLNLQ